MMNVVHTTGDDRLARVFVAELADGSRIEFVESVQPPVPRDEKWVLIVSTLKGCPVGCPICDAGRSYAGRLSEQEILAQIEYLVERRYPDGRVPVPKLKIQFARMGEPSFNPAVLAVLGRLPERFDAPGLLPSISTVAPAGRDQFFEELRIIKDRYYGAGRFQMQISVHTTDEMARRKLVPVRSLDLAEMAALGDRFFAPGDRKVTLNFAAVRGMPVEPSVLAPLFSPERFLIKLTPVNPTRSALRSGATSLIDPADEEANRACAARFETLGYDTIVSVGELEENAIGSNCGMYITRLSEGESRSDRSPEADASARPVMLSS